MTHITGPVVLPDGSPAISRAVKFTRAEHDLIALPAGVVVPEVVTVRTDATGLIDVELLPGAYTVSVPMHQGAAPAAIVVPDAATAAFPDLVANGHIPEAKPAWFDVAVSASLPPGEPGQVMGYGAGGNLTALAGGGYDDTVLAGRVSAVETVVADLPPPFDPAPLTGRVAALEAAPAPSWGEVTGKPALYPPASHVHAIADVTGLQGALDDKAATGHTHAWIDITAKPAVIAAGADQAAARAAIGAGTSSLTIGTTASTAKAGNYAPTWAQVTSKPTTFPPDAHTHAWADLTDKPATFPAAAHTHAIADVTGLQSALDGKATAAQGVKADTAIQLAALQAYTAPVKIITQAQYDALSPPDAGTVYVVQP